MQVVVNGLLANYQKYGRGPVIILLHGWGDSSATFAKLTEQLEKRYTVLALDLPGFGDSERVPENWGLEDYAAFVKAWLAKLKISEPLALIGHSYGGAVAITGAGKGLFKPQKLVLLASAGIRNKNKLRKSALQVVAKAGKAVLVFVPAKHRVKLRRKFYGSIGSDILVVPEMEQVFRRIIGEDVRQYAKEISVPTLLIYGNKDEATPLQDGHILNQIIKGSELSVVEGAGHWLHQQQAEQVTQLVEIFLGHKK